MAAIFIAIATSLLEGNTIFMVMYKSTENFINTSKRISKKDSWQHFLFVSAYSSQPSLEDFRKILCNTYLEVRLAHSLSMCKMLNVSFYVALDE